MAKKKGKFKPEYEPYFENKNRLKISLNYLIALRKEGIFFIEEVLKGNESCNAKALFNAMKMANGIISIFYLEIYNQLVSLAEVNEEDHKLLSEKLTMKLKTIKALDFTKSLP